MAMTVNTGCDADVSYIGVSLCTANGEYLALCHPDTDRL